MKNQLKESDITRIVKKVKGNDLNEGWFSDLFKSKFEKYSGKISTILTSLKESADNEKLKNSITSLSRDISNSNLDRRDKSDLENAMKRITYLIDDYKSGVDDLMRDLSSGQYIDPQNRQNYNPQRRPVRGNYRY